MTAVLVLALPVTGCRLTGETPPARVPAAPGGTPVGGRAEDPLSAHRPRPAPGATAVRLGKAASAERSETRSPRPRRARAGARCGGVGADPDRGREPTAGVGADAAAPPPAAPRVSGLEELVHVAVSVLRLAAEASGLSGQDVERQVADTLAFLRRRLTGDYAVDEFGFDEDLTEHAYLPLLRPLYRSWFRVEVRGIENIPLDGWRAGRGQPLRHDRAGLADDPGGRARRAPRAPAPADARRRPGLPDPGHRRHRPQERLDPGRQLRRRAAAGLRRADRRLARGVQGRRQAVQRALQAAAVRPRRVRVRGAAHRARRSSRARSSGPRRSTRSWATSRRSPG